jgi:hypothetical protein
MARNHAEGRWVVHFHFVLASTESEHTVSANRAARNRCDDRRSEVNGSASELEVADAACAGRLVTSHFENLGHEAAYDGLMHSELGKVDDGDLGIGRVDDNTLPELETGSSASERRPYPADEGASATGSGTRSPASVANQMPTENPGEDDTTHPSDN